MTPFRVLGVGVTATVGGKPVTEFTAAELAEELFPTVLLAAVRVLGGVYTWTFISSGRFHTKFKVDGREFEISAARYCLSDFPGKFLNT
jgi:hypothetical protein